MSDRLPLVVRLKSGEYDGADIMQAWLLIENQQQHIAELEAELEQANAYKPVSVSLMRDNKRLREALLECWETEGLGREGLATLKLAREGRGDG